MTTNLLDPAPAVNPVSHPVPERRPAAPRAKRCGRPRPTGGDLSAVPSAGVYVPLAPPGRCEECLDDRAWVVHRGKRSAKCLDCEVRYARGFDPSSDRRAEDEWVRLLLTIERCLLSAENACEDFLRLYEGPDGVRFVEPMGRVEGPALTIRHVATLRGLFDVFDASGRLSFGLGHLPHNDALAGER